MFQMIEEDPCLPISWEEYTTTMDAFEKSHFVNQVFGWIIFAAAGVWGMVQVIKDGGYVSFFLAFLAAFVLRALLELRDQTGALLPLMELRDELIRQWTAQYSVDGVLLTPLPTVLPRPDRR